MVGLGSRSAANHHEKKYVIAAAPAHMDTGSARGCNLFKAFSPTMRQLNYRQTGLEFCNFPLRLPANNMKRSMAPGSNLAHVGEKTRIIQHISLTEPQSAIAVTAANTESAKDTRDW